MEPELNQIIACELFDLNKFFHVESDLSSSYQKPGKLLKHRGATILSVPDLSNVDQAVLEIFKGHL
jgi:hypothetical protein